MTEINFTGVRRDDGSSPASLPGGGFVRVQFFGQSSFSKLAVVKVRSEVRCDVVDQAELAVMAPMGCGYLTGAGTVMNVLKPRKGGSMVIFGLGGVGLAALMASKAVGVEQIIVVDIVDAKLEMAASLGAKGVINTKREDEPAAIRAACPGGVDSVLDTTGVTELLETGIKCLSHGGVMALVGVPRPEQVVGIDPLAFLLECKTVVGVVEGAANPGKVSRLWA
jgi:Zn-dependent alcohol dehydrogenase